MTLGELARLAKPSSIDLNKIAVSLYKLLGFFLLFVILVGLVSYLLMHVFFFVNTSWATPLVVSPTDPRVLQMNSQLAQGRLLLDELLTREARVKADIDKHASTVELQERYQRGALGLLRSDLSEALSELRAVASLAGKASASRRKVVRSQAEFETAFRSRLQDMHDARVIDDGDFMQGEHQLTQLELTRLSLAERDKGLSVDVKHLRRKVGAIRGALVRLGASDDRDPDLARVAPTLEVLRVEHEYHQAESLAQQGKLELAHANKDLERLTAAVARQERLMVRLERSPYQRAASSELNAAFVPYDNIAAAWPGTAVYACHLGPLLCFQVGTVRDVLDGEVKGKHPLRNLELRGVLVELELTDPGAAEDAVLHMGRPPLFL